MSNSRDGHNPSRRTKFSEHWFRRENDGSVRIKIRFSAEEAALIEEAAGETPLLPYIHRVLRERSRYHIKKRAEADARAATTAADGRPTRVQSPRQT